MTTDIPQGFVPWVPTTPFVTHVATIGPIYKKESDSILALRLQETHANMHQIAHGGLLATLADCTLGYYIPLQCNTSIVTASMSIDYLNAAKIGDWLESRITIDKQGKRLIYATCLLQVDDVKIVRATGIFATRDAK